jgi:hypothetical protein
MICRMLAAAGRGADINDSGSNYRYAKGCRAQVKEWLMAGLSAAFDAGGGVGLNSGSLIERTAIEA